MEQLQSQQSLVRTDFTLKYYQLESLLNEHQIVNITGTDNQVFIRSWLDYSQAKGEGAVTWVAGDFNLLLEKFSHFSSQTISDESELLDYFYQLKRKLVLCIDANRVPDEEQTLLINVIEKLRSSKNATDEENDQEKLADSTGLTDEADNQNSAASDSNSTPSDLLKVVFCISQKDTQKSIYKKLSQLSTSYQVGLADKPKEEHTQKTGSMGKVAVFIGALLLVGAGGWWFYSTEPFNSQQESADAGSVPAQSEPKSVESITQETSVSKTDTPQTVNQKQGEPTAELSDESVDASKSSVAEAQEAKASEASNEPSVVSEASSSESNTEQSKQSNDVVETYPIAIAKTVDASLNPEKNSKARKSEQVSITSVKSANVINLSSSIKTASGVDSSIAAQSESESKNNTADTSADIVTRLIDGWINAWQNQNFDKYQEFYSDDFISGGQNTHEKWLKWRKTRIERPKWIKLSRSNIKHLPVESNEYYEVQLTLMYSSPNYRDKTFKKMTLKKLNETTFKIVKEENLKVTRI